MFELVKYLEAKGGSLPPFFGGLYEEITARNGTFRRVKRLEFEVLLRRGDLISARASSSCFLDTLTPYFRWKLPKVPAEALRCILFVFRKLAPLEVLLYLTFERGEWEVVFPSQIQTEHSVSPIGSPFLTGQNGAVIELHSHHEMPAQFSRVDDEDETGCRIYSVLGTIFTRPTLRTRVGAFNSTFWEIPSDWVFDLPTGISDARSENGYLQ